MPIEPTNTVAMRLMSDLMRDYGLNAIEASGIVGTLGQESGRFQTLEEAEPQNTSQYYRPNEATGGFGYGQWTGARRQNFDNYIQQTGLDPFGYDANYGFLKSELSGPYANEIARIRGVTDPAEVARLFTGSSVQGNPLYGTGFERPGPNPHLDVRGGYANEFNKLYQNQGGYYGDNYYGDPQQPTGYQQSGQAPSFTNPDTYGPTSSRDVRTWDPQTGLPYTRSSYAPTQFNGDPAAGYNNPAFGSAGYNPGGLQPSFTGPYNYGYSDASPAAGAPTQFSGDPSAGYNNPAFGSGGGAAAYPAYSNTQFSGDPAAGWNNPAFSFGGGQAFTGGPEYYRNAQYMKAGGSGFGGDPRGTWVDQGNGGGYWTGQSTPSAVDFSGVNTYSNGTAYTPAASSYTNNEFGYGGSEYLPQFSNTPAAYNTLNFTVGGPTSTSDSRTWDPQTGLPYGGSIGASAPSAGSLNGFSTPGVTMDYAAGVSPTPGYTIQPGTAAATLGGGLTQQDADTQFAEYQALQANLQNYANTYQAGLNALPSSPQNYYSQIVQPYERNFGGQIAGYNPFTTQYQAY